MGSADHILTVLLVAADFLAKEEAPEEILESYYELTRIIKVAVPIGNEVLDLEDPSSVRTHYANYPQLWLSSLRNELVESAFDQDEQVLKATETLMSRLPGIPITLPPLPKPKPEPKSGKKLMA
jgi:hypothetical protein